MPVVKHSLLVTDPRQIPEYIHKAFHIASTGRPGPVLVDVPQDLSRAEIDYDAGRGHARAARLQAADRGQHQADPDRRQGARQRAPAGDLRRRRDRQRQRLGGVPRVLRLRQSCPVTLTVMGLGAFPAPHEQWLGMLGMHGTRTANYAMDEADLIVCVGARFDDRITGKLSEFAPRAKFVHIDVDPAEISKNVPAHIPIVGDAKDVLPKLTREYRALKADSARLDDWWKQIREWQSDLPAALRGLAPTPRSSRSSWSRRCTRRPRATRSSPPTSASTRCGRRSTTTSTEPRRWLNSGGLGTMGFGLPAAIGAKVALPGRDGRLPRRRRQPGDGLPGVRDRRPPRDPGQGLPDEQRPLRHGPPVAGAVLGRSATSRSRWAPSPDWPKLAEAFGWTGMQCTDKAELRDAMRTRSRPTARCCSTST